VSGQEHAVIRPPEGDLVNVGELLADVADAFTALGMTLTSAGTPIETGAAALRLGGVIRNASQVFAHIQLSVPKEPDSGS
jgi:hypothetical protein